MQPIPRARILHEGTQLRASPQPVLLDEEEQTRYYAVPRSDRQYANEQEASSAFASGMICLSLHFPYFLLYCVFLD